MSKNLKFNRRLIGEVNKAAGAAVWRGKCGELGTGEYPASWGLASPTGLWAGVGTWGAPPCSRDTNKQSKRTFHLKGSEAWGLSQATTPIGLLREWLARGPLVALEVS